MTRPCNNQQKKRIYRIVDFAVPANDRIKLEESEKGDKYLDFARELKNTVEDERDSDTNSNWSKITKGIEEGQEDVEIIERVETI